MAAIHVAGVRGDPCGAVRWTLKLRKNVLLFKFSCNIFIGVRIIKEMLGSVASGTHCIKLLCNSLCTSVDSIKLM